MHDSPWLRGMRLQVGALKNSYSFNTILTNANGLPVSIAINNVPGQGITLVGSTNAAALADGGMSVCQANPVSPLRHHASWGHMRMQGWTDAESQNQELWRM